MTTQSITETGTREKLYALVVAWRRQAGLREALRYVYDPLRDEVEGVRVGLTAEESVRELEARGWKPEDIARALYAMRG